MGLLYLFTTAQIMICCFSLAPCELPLITNGQYLSGYRAGLTIANGSSVTFQCDSDYSKSTGQPVECILGELRPHVPACRHNTLPTMTYSSKSNLKVCDSGVLLKFDTHSIQLFPLSHFVKNALCFGSFLCFCHQVQ